MVKYLKYTINGLLGTGIETILLWVFSVYIFHNYVGDYIIAPIIAFELELISNFLISYYWIWNKNISVQSQKPLFTHFILYNSSSTLGFFIKMGFLLLFEKAFGWDVIYCNLGALTISGSVNFLLAEKVIFSKSFAGSFVHGLSQTKTKKDDLMH